MTTRRRRVRATGHRKAGGRRGIWSLSIFLLIGVLGLFTTGAGAQQGVQAHADRGEASPGDTIRVSGSGWPAGQRLQASVCGNQALAGSVDCDLAGSRSTVTNADGSFTTEIQVGAPPSPCPCVVFFVAQGTSETVRFPIAIEAAAGTTPVAPSSRAESLEVRDVRIAGSGPWTSWLGASPKRTLLLTIQNTSPKPLVPTVDVAWGRGERPTGLIEIEGLDELAAGEERTFRVPVTLDPLAWGRYTLVGEVSNGATSVPFAVETTAYPWAWIATVLGALQALLLRHWWRRRRRRAGAAPDPARQAGPDGRAPENDSSREAGAPPIPDLTSEAERVPVMVTSVPPASGSAAQRIATALVATARVTARSILADAERVAEQADRMLEASQREAENRLALARAEAEAMLDRARTVAGATTDRQRAEAPAVAWRARHDMLAGPGGGPEPEPGPAAPPEGSGGAEVIDLRAPRPRERDPFAAAIRRAVAEALDG